ncbi:ABC transporter permease [Amycolatopsis rhabdoformis]|uniref:ABC transporter permease n=1 Tax=Amycolatopsis rhabdoformis TaxID=1448059 RepID=A0ABZ1IKR5_9PSEU|nr:ABC transporter permease [Amycolatopsis rhabdoformis]WSE34090.1 ABC transporter permease [Amycolatopsis rhabdoformis]
MNDTVERGRWTVRVPRGLFPALLWTASGLLLGFILLPVFGLITATSPGGLRAAVANEEIRDAVLLSVQDAAITAVVATVLGVPLAYLLARRRFPGHALVQAIVDLPLAIPHTVAGIALLFVFGRTGWLGTPAQATGFPFYGTQAGIIVAMLFVSAPFAVNSARVAFEALDPFVERAARSLGATPGQTFRRVTVPLAWRGVLTGAVLVYARSISEFGAVVILAYYPATAPVAIYNLFLSSGLAESASAAVLLLLVALATFLVLRTLASGWLVAGATRPRR